MAGIGKTALLRVATDAARERGFRVLRARPSEAERTLSFAALADLLGEAHEVIEQLPTVQRRPPPDGQASIVAANQTGRVPAQA